LFEVKKCRFFLPRSQEYGQEREGDQTEKRKKELLEERDREREMIDSEGAEV
jgi:hypothetical protein